MRRDDDVASDDTASTATTPPRDGTTPVAPVPEEDAAEPPAEQVPIEEQLQSFLEGSVAVMGLDAGVALHVDAPALGLDWEGAVGLADPVTGEVMTPAHPVRLASNTKTYVAAAVLRLWEQGRIDLDEPIASYLPAESVAALERGGYRPELITVRHLLTHTSGLFDYAAALEWVEAVVADPTHRWTRADQLEVAVENGDPIGEPGAVYHYSDTGYILLGQMLEDLTDSTLAEAVWSLIDRPRLGLTATWFETLEPRPVGVLDRAHQFGIDGTDTTAFDPSFDLWGGGGIVATVGDLARFTRALFTGEVYDDPATLDTMLTTLDGVRAAPDARPGDLPPGVYRMGVFVIAGDDVTMHGHGGFWGTWATWVPELDLVITLTVNQAGAEEQMLALQEGVLTLVR